MAEPIDDSQINPIFLQQLQDALESDEENNTNNQQVEDLDLGVDDQLLVDSLRSIISGENHEPSQQQNWNQVLDGNPDPATLEAVQNALRELGGHEVPTASGGWKRSLTEEDRDRIRQDNRARKRRWRDSHAVRNRDNELRGRIVRKANQIFGDQSTPQKDAWIEDEFHRRREGRSRDDGPPLYDLFRQGGASGLEASRYASITSNNTHLIHAALNSPRPPAYLVKYTHKESVRLPIRIRTHEAKSLGAPPKLERLAQKYIPNKPSKKFGELGEKLGLTPLPKSVIERFGLPNAPEDLRKLGPMPPLPKSIIEHQKREKERKEKEEKEKEEKAALEMQREKEKEESERQARETSQNAANTSVPDIPTAPAAPAPEIPTAPPPASIPEIPCLGPRSATTPATTNTPSVSSNPIETLYHDTQGTNGNHQAQHAQPQIHKQPGDEPRESQEQDHEEFAELDNIDDVLGNALSALQTQDTDIMDPSQAIKELQMALEQQGLFEQE